MGKMAEVQRRLLEQMMGPEAMGFNPPNLDWWNEKVCRDYLFGTCLHDTFSNTKMDLGPCPKTHSDRILKQFQEAQKETPPDPRIAAFRQEHENNIYQFVDECDRRIRASQRKLEKTPEENRKTVDLMKEIGEIELAIQGGTDEIEELGAEGKVDESMEKLAAVDALKQLKNDKEKELQVLNENAGASGHQKLRVCEICGAMLSVLDSDKRLADHFGGKMHLGFHELRKLMALWAEERMRGPPPAPLSVPPPSVVPSGPPPPGPGGNRPPVPPFPLADDKREAGEIGEDGTDRSRSRDRFDDRRGSSGRDRYDDRERFGTRDRYGDRERDRYGDREKSRYDDRDRRDKYDDDRRRDRSRSPSKRRVV
ncbi:hypothetical protein CcaverHIS002_0509320 [Cutaneotrichosporon cavernicola]|uniref:LUC7-domain-containing protein n=1 Tax=Cutaneotrichosporon cavernicola TaxID=279322 RepID=A0AA48QXH3_9TREE|nr:uncharacterized protein CcaverHIS019_0509880 [Cutaneotrichosporon cavernicola]BEI85531.1 hypothetical protein CcaverHIS002_0509320 [Cutaneotrichosporon cavernicola]BEI93360.1 hypothetical protein CcaverHIS019_0509880 [Cutaneotrichosporon cavernicola]BEJ01139.1 hypothetical protein CcaverHIS631_0509960 [Cutaneotrichosporon cavernicola]BEJ08907.1 hypothetical protein CcaverHIS641_0510010 [Cutaneotrichosporon cavernicola]